MRIRTLNYWFICLFVVFLSACGGYEKVLKSDDINYKLTKANEYYDKKQFQKANAVYENLMPIVKGTKNFEPMYFKYAYSYYYMDDHLSSSYHFKNFVDYFPSSSVAEEAEYMHAVSLHKLSPKSTLEQTNTIKAMEALQSYINTHPDSKRLTEANALMDEMRKKLEEKEAAAARLYYNISQYRAASIAYKSVLQNYPESPNGDLYQYNIVRSLYHYANASVPARQEERYVSMINAFNELKLSYPNSKYLGEAQRYYSQANEKINKLRNEHQ
jgi:outer membrane protein assembly factor BamD